MRAFDLAGSSFTKPSKPPTQNKNFLGLDYLRTLDAEEHAAFAFLYNCFAKLWNEHETNRGKPLFFTYNGVDFSMTHSRGKLICYLTWCGLCLVAHVPGWDTWEPNGVFAPFTRQPLTSENIRSVTLLRSPAKRKLFPNFTRELREAHRRYSLPLENRGRINPEEN